MQSGLAGGFGADRAGRVDRALQVREDARGQRQGGKGGGAPDRHGCGEIDSRYPGAVAWLACQHPGEAESQVVLGQEGHRDASPDVRLVGANPEERGEHEAGGNPAAETRKEGRRFEQRFGLCGLCPGALIGPDDRRAEQPVARVEQHRAVHLAADAEGGHRFGGGIGVGKHCADSLARRFPPGLRRLLGPARLRHLYGVAASGGGERCAVLTEQHDLQTGGAEIDAEAVTRTGNCGHRCSFLDALVAGRVPPVRSRYGTSAPDLFAGYSGMHRAYHADSARAAAMVKRTSSISRLVQAIKTM